MKHNRKPDVEWIEGDSALADQPSADEDQADQDRYIDAVGGSIEEHFRNNADRETNGQGAASKGSVQ